jgi:hypothetical protein
MILVISSEVFLKYVVNGMKDVIEFPGFYQILPITGKNYLFSRFMDIIVIPLKTVSNIGCEKILVIEIPIFLVNGQ